MLYGLNNMHPAASTHTKTKPFKSIFPIGSFYLLILTEGTGLAMHKPKTPDIAFFILKVKDN